MITDGDLSRALRHEADLRAGANRGSRCPRPAGGDDRPDRRRPRDVDRRPRPQRRRARSPPPTSRSWRSSRATPPPRPSWRAEALTNDPPSEVVGLARFVRDRRARRGGQARRRPSRAGRRPADAEAAGPHRARHAVGRRPRGRRGHPGRARCATAPRRRPRCARGVLLGPPRRGAVPPRRLGRRRHQRRAGRLARPRRRGAAGRGRGQRARELRRVEPRRLGDRDGPRLDGGDGGRRCAPLVGRPAARRVRAGRPRAGPRRPRGDGEGLARATPTRPSRGSVDRVGVLPWRTLQRRGAARAAPDGRGRGRARRPGGALPGLVGGRRGPAALRDHRDPRAGAGAGGLRATRWPSPSGCPPRWPAPAWRRRTAGTCSTRATAAAPSTCCAAPTNGSNTCAPRRSSPSAPSCCTPPGCTRPPRAARSTLTTQELAVARLVAEGRTNQETGTALFVTGRTVAFHLSNIYAKLGVSSRRELAARLAV